MTCSAGNSTRGWVAGGGTRAQGGGGLYGISKRKAERKAARVARKQQPTLAQLRAAWNKQQVRLAMAERFASGTDMTALSRLRVRVRGQGQGQWQTSLNTLLDDLA